MTSHWRVFFPSRLSPGQWIAVSGMWSGTSPEDCIEQLLAAYPTHNAEGGRQYRVQPAHGQSMVDVVAEFIPPSEGRFVAKRAVSAT